MFFAFFLIIILVLNFINIHSYFFSITSKLHLFCLYQAPQSTWKQAYLGIVCGQSLPAGEFKEALIATGLIHIIVVSGAHLVLLNRFLNRVLTHHPCPVFTLGFFLVIYCGICKLEPPVVRAFLALHLFILNHQLKLYWPPLKVIYVSGLVCLLLFPEWFFSKSLQMSWLASMAIHPSKNTLIHTSLCYVLLFPLLMDFSPLSPWTILINALLAPLAGSLLFPLSLIAFLIPPLHWVTDLLWSFTNELIHLLKDILPPQPHIDPLNLSIHFYWLFLFFIYWILHLRERTCLK